MNSKKRNEGYLLIDHSQSPGVSEELLQQSGIPGAAVGPGKVFEAATITCSHCQTMVILNPLRTRARNYCAKCDHYICDNPGCNAECLPMSKVLDDLQNAALHQIGKETING